MAASAEHEFLGTTFAKIMDEFSELDLYALDNVDRQQFDFACDVTTPSWSRALVGQTLWRNVDGIEKDISTLLFGSTAEIKAYIVPADAALQVRLSSTLERYRTSRRVDDELFRLVRFTVSPFDADNEEQRALVAEELRQQVVVDNLLFRVVFGHLTAQDVLFFLHPHSGPMITKHRPVNLRLLQHLHSDGFTFIKTAAEVVDASPSIVSKQLHILRGAGFLRSAGHKYVVTDKARFFLKLVDRLALEVRLGLTSPELRFLLARVGCPVAYEEVRMDDVRAAVDAGEEWVLPPFGMLFIQVVDAGTEYRPWYTGLDPAELGAPWLQRARASSSRR